MYRKISTTRPEEARVFQRLKREREARKEATMSDHIPQALLIEILARLTVGDLGRCISVCKSWYSLITSPHFVSIHTKQLAASTTSSNTDLLLVRDAPDRERYSLLLHNKNQTFPVYKIFDFPFKSYNSHFRIVGCSNGVICLSDDLIAVLQVIILWNPSIRKSITLPGPLVTCHSHGPFDQFIGFGFNSATNDYKVVRVVYLKSSSLSPPLVEVYDLCVGSWKSVDPKGFSYFISPYCSQIFLDGAVHWVGGHCNEGDTRFHNMIVSFDLRTDIFGRMKFPDSLADIGYCGELCVTALGESLALLHHVFSGNDVRCGDVWVMKQYGVSDSWTKLFSIDLTGGLLKVCGILKNEEPLVIVEQREDPYSNDRTKVLVLYDSKNKQRNFIGIIWKKNSVYVDYFVESLALLGVKGESVEQEESNNTPV